MVLKSKSSGFSLIETLVGSAVFVMLALSAYKAFEVLMDVVATSQAKITATTLANEKFEIIRNLPYTDVGIVAGLPSGKIKRNETIVKDNFSFDTTTTIRNVDDPFDGTIGGSPSDSSPADYKLVDLEINCSNCRSFTPLGFTTLIAPHSLETASSNGALFIRVFDASGLPVQGASLHIKNTNTDPDTIIDETTDNEGWVKIIDAPTGTFAYEITASKSGYTTDKTYLPGGDAGPNPTLPNPTVVTQQVTQTSLSIDMLSSISVETYDTSCVLLPSLSFSLTGTKKIGENILKYPAQEFTSDSTGHLEIPDMEWDSYSTLLSSSSYDLAGVNPFPIFSLPPNENKTIKIIANLHSGNSVLVSVKDSLGEPINDATVLLQKTGFEETKTTGQGSCTAPGQVFWSGLESGNYTLTVTKNGYQEEVVSFSSSSWKNETITLTP